MIEGVASVTVSALVTTESLTGLQCNTVDVGAYPTGDFKLTECGSFVDLTGMQTEASGPVWMKPFCTKDVGRYLGTSLHQALAIVSYFQHVFLSTFLGSY